MCVCTTFKKPRRDFAGRVERGISETAKQRLASGIGTVRARAVAAQRRGLKMTLDTRNLAKLWGYLKRKYRARDPASAHTHTWPRERDKVREPLLGH